MTRQELDIAARDSHNNNEDDCDCPELENCACAVDLMNLGLDCADTMDQYDGECLEALIQAHLQLCLSCQGTVDRQLGGVAAGGHLLGFIAFARKMVRVVLSLSLLCGILFVSFYLGSNYGGNSTTTTITTSLATVDSGRGNRQPCYYS